MAAVLMKNVFIMLIGMFISAGVAAQKEVTLTSGEWAPYTSQGLKHYGVFSHIVTESFAQVGYTVKYSFFPWKRSYSEAKKGRFDGSITWAPTPERRLDFYFSDPVTYIRKVFFHLKSFPFTYKDINDLTSIRIGATDQYTYGPEFDEAAKSGLLNVDYVNSDVLNVRKLLKKRIDIFPMEIEVGYSLILNELSESQIHLITNHPKPITETPISVLFSKSLSKGRAEKLLKDFNRGLNMLKESGKYDEMIRNSRQGSYLLSGKQK